MRTIIYIGLVGFLFISGFFSLKSNDWEVRELPSFLEVGSSVDRVLPFEDWESNLIGNWKLKVSFVNSTWKGKISYNEDKTFVQRLSYESESFKSGGTIRGRWQMNEDGTWTEFNEECNFSNKSELLCSWFGDEDLYGLKEDATHDFTVPYFNHDRIEIRSESLADGSISIWKFTREE
jgi:hypothetical protein